MLKGDNLVTQSNALNEMRRSGMSLQQMRFFLVYLSRIYKDSIDTRKVKFPLDEFIKIMNINPSTSISYIKGVTNDLLQVVLTEQTGEAGQYRQYQLFKECEVSDDELGRWYITVDAHDRVIPYLFEFQNKFFSYELWNTVRLTSTNQIRLYEILKQYERTKHKSVTLTLEELKYKLGIEPEEYTRWGNFKDRVIEPCKKALKEKTDICFEYTTIKKGKAIVALTFKISKNEEYDHQISINEYIDESRIIKKRDDFETEEEYRAYCLTLPQDIQDSIIADEIKLAAIEELKEVVNFAFTEEEIGFFYDRLCQIIPDNNEIDPKIIKEQRKERLGNAYKRLKFYEVHNEVHSRSGFINEVLEDDPKVSTKKKGTNVRRTGKEAGIVIDETPVNHVEDETEEEKKARLEENSKLFGMDLTEE